VLVADRAPAIDDVDLHRGHGRPSEIRLSPYTRPGPPSRSQPFGV